QKQMKAASEHCSVPMCSVSSRYNSCTSFHSFPVNEEIRKKWILNIRRINFQITKHTVYAVYISNQMILFATYKHMMAFWEQIEPSTHRMICVTSSKVTRETGLYVKTRALPAIDEFFLFLMHLALGLKQKDLAHRFHGHAQTSPPVIPTPKIVPKACGEDHPRQYDHIVFTLDGQLITEESEDILMAQGLLLCVYFAFGIESNPVS
ncbi:hypothetical protein DPX16_16941, partial [Anabarilius grahami]